MSKDTEQQDQDERQDCPPSAEACFYRIRCRPQGQEQTAKSSMTDLVAGEVALIKIEDRLEPIRIVCRAAAEPGIERGYSCTISRRANGDEKERYAQLPSREHEAAAFCKERIKALDLPMHLVRAECYFNGSKVIFYFTAESRVDFRELVKDLVQEFRTRVEMRQIGVRHETQMTGGIGTCGRELCCTSFLRNFESVSIKMAKAQDLPLNPAKISGVCNRLLCCLTYEFDSYRLIKREMPRVDSQIAHKGAVYRVARIFPMQGTVLAVAGDGTEEMLTEEQWRESEPVLRQASPAKKKSKGSKKDAPQKNKKS